MIIYKCVCAHVDKWLNSMIIIQFLKLMKVFVDTTIMHGLLLLII